MTIIQPVLPAGNEAERAALRPTGRNRDVCNAAIHHATQIINAADVTAPATQPASLHRPAAMPWADVVYLPFRHEPGRLCGQALECGKIILIVST